MKYIFCGILILIVLVSGCTSSTPSTGSQQTLVTTSPTESQQALVTTPQPSLTEELPSSSNHLQGNGNDVKSFATTGSGIRIFTMDYQGKDTFTVVLQDSQGKNLEVLADETGSYNGIMASDPLETGTYKLEVKASGPWTIDITGPEA